MHQRCGSARDTIVERLRLSTSREPVEVLDTGLMPKPLGPPELYYAQLARVRQGAGALITTPGGRVVMYDVAYRDYLELPSGAVETGETPPAACAPSESRSPTTVRDSFSDIKSKQASPSTASRGIRRWRSGKLAVILEALYKRLLAGAMSVPVEK